MVKTTALLVVVFTFILIHGVLASTGETKATQISATESGQSGFTRGLIEFSTSYKSSLTETTKEFDSLSLNDQRTFSLDFMFGTQSDFNRTYFGVGYENMGTFETNTGEKIPLSHLLFKLSYDRVLGPWLTDWYLNGSARYIMPQGKKFVHNSVEFAPEMGFGIDLGLGWQTPLGFGLTFGYRVQWRSFSYYKASQVGFESNRTLADIGYSGPFITFSLGRY